MKLDAYGSAEYHQSSQLRYHLFYQEQNIPFEAIWDPQEKEVLHFVITANSGNRVLAYGRLRQNSLDEVPIYPMVVVPEYQGQGLGSLILQALAQIAIE